jgi:hypothetical protein
MHLAESSLLQVSWRRLQWREESRHLMGRHEGRTDQSRDLWSTRRGEARQRVMRCAVLCSIRSNGNEVAPLGQRAPTQASKLEATRFSQRSTSTSTSTSDPFPVHQQVFCSRRPPCHVLRRCCGATTLRLVVTSDCVALETPRKPSPVSRGRPPHLTSSSWSRLSLVPPSLYACTDHGRERDVPRRQRLLLDTHAPPRRTSGSRQSRLMEHSRGGRTRRVAGLTSRGVSDPN